MRAIPGAGPRTNFGRIAAAAATVLTLTLVASCSGGSDDSSDPDDAGKPDGSGSATAQAGEGSTDPSSPTKLKPTKNLLEWESLPLNKSTVTTNGDWTLTVPDSGTEAVASMGSTRHTVQAGSGSRIVDAFLGGGYAVVVSQDEQEQRPQAVTVLDVESGKTEKVTDPPMGSGGPFAYADGTLLYASTTGPDYCLATYDVAEGNGSTGYCAPARHGFSNLSTGPAGDALMSFDNKRPVSCRTLLQVEDDGSTTTVEGPKKCLGWDVSLTQDGAVWSELTDEKNVETGDFFASHGGRYFALGTGNTSTLTSCGDSTYFATEAGDIGKAQLMRWTPEGTLEVAYESSGSGPAFLAPPACADGVLTLTAYGEGGGDERVSATVPE